MAGPRLGVEEVGAPSDRVRALGGRPERAPDLLRGRGAGDEDGAGRHPRERIRPRRRGERPGEKGAGTGPDMEAPLDRIEPEGGRSDLARVRGRARRYAAAGQVELPARTAGAGAPS